jgi:predicted RNA-binding protein YlqC (UPF0109 family)
MLQNRKVIMSSNDDIKVIRVAPRRPATDSSTNNIREAGKEMILTVLRLMMDKPECLKVECIVGERTTVFKIECHPETLGQLIGAKGKNISGLRAIVTAAMARQGIRAILEIPYLAPSKDSNHNDED